MSRRRNIPGALHNFLSAFGSRYSDYDGYWLLGFLAGDDLPLQIDLFEGANRGESAIEVARKLARQKFATQLQKSGIPHPWVTSAQLTILKAGEAQEGFVNGHRALGIDMQLTVTAITDLGKTYVRSHKLFVVPHNPNIESRSTRAT